jgi:uncharacterized membrane protein
VFKNGISIAPIARQFAWNLNLINSLENCMSEPNLTKTAPHRQKPLSSLDIPTSEDIKSRHAITILLSPQEVYSFWRNFSNLTTFMKDVHSIEAITPTRSHWVIQLKSGQKVEWDADIVNEQPGYMISWESVPGSEVSTRGSVWFEEASGKQGTVVRLAMDYKVPGGKLAELAAFFTGESPEILIKTNLKRLKAYLETGEIPTTEGQSSGREEDQHITMKH